MHTPIGAQRSVRSYALTHRAGRVDAAWTIGGERELRQGETRKLIWPARFESGVIDMAGSTAAMLRPFGVEGPWAVLVSVAGVAGYELVLGGAETSDPAWQPTATLREIVVDQLTPDTLLPIFAAFWRVFGHERPGNWSPPT